MVQAAVGPSTSNGNLLHDVTHPHSQRTSRHSLLFITLDKDHCLLNEPTELEMRDEIFNFKTSINFMKFLKNFDAAS